MRAKLELQSPPGAMQRLALIMPDPDGGPNRYVQVDMEKDAKAIAVALSRLIDWIVHNVNG